MTVTAFPTKTGADRPASSGERVRDLVPGAELLPALAAAVVLVICLTQLF